MNSGFHIALLVSACRFSILIAAAGLIMASAEADVVLPQARILEDGRSFQISASAIQDFKATWSATIQRGESREKVLSSADGVVKQGSVTITSFHEEKIELLFQLETRKDAPGIRARVGVRNGGDSPVRFISATPFAADWKLPTNLDGWFLTGLHAATPLVLAIREIHQPAKVHEHGGYYHSSGNGFLFAPVGKPVAYLSGRFARLGEDRMYFNYTADMSGVRVNPGETRWGQQAVLLFEPPRKALPCWADWVGRSHDARTKSPPLVGWGSWYSFGDAITSKDVLGQVEEVRKHPEHLRPDVILIDRGHEVRKQFPEGLAFCADAITGSGARAGIRLELRDAADPNASIRQAVRDGFRYIKLGDFEPPALASDPGLTEFERRRKCYAGFRESAGPDTYLLDCPLYLDRASVGHVDASRTGRTAWRKEVLPAIKEVLRSYYLNGRWFSIDNDHFYLGTDLDNVSEIKGGWPIVRTWMSMAGLSCGAAFTSDPLNLESVKPFWRNLEVMTPPAKEETEVLDLAKDWRWQRLVGQVRREWGDATVALLWNAEDREKTVNLKFKEAGMDAKQRYAVWSFWDNRYLGLSQEFWNTPSMAPSASQHLRFTPIPANSIPVLIGSNLHIYCGAAEIKAIRSGRSAMTIELTDAGARAGDLFVYSRYQPVLRGTSGLTVTALDQAGENVWRIRMRDRKYGSPQRLDLSIQLPVTLQWWFWLMIVVMIGSSLTAGWRYVAWLKLDRKHSLAMERSRIARDLHDDLGANLAEIAMISDLAQDQLPEDDPSRQSLNEIFSRAETNARRLGEIVWAINPANDTLECFAGFLCKFAQDYLGLARVGCRLDVPSQLPPLSLNSIQRHHLFLSAKEAIHNAVRHGKPSEVTLRLAVSSGQVNLVIEDDGCGFDCTDSAMALRGIRNLRDRMDKICGTFACHSHLGRGTIVTLTAPLKS